MKYKLEPDGGITYGTQVVLQYPDVASANMIVQALQDAADRSYKEGIEDVCSEARRLLDGPPDENRPMVAQQSTNHGRRVGP